MEVGKLVKALGDHAEPGSKRHEEIKGAITIVASKTLADAIDRHEAAESRLSNRLLWLNIILGAFTVIGTILAVIGTIPAVIAFIQQSP